jgi:hypothetical protein
VQIRELLVHVEERFFGVRKICSDEIHGLYGLEEGDLLRLIVSQLMIVEPLVQVSLLPPDIQEDTCERFSWALNWSARQFQKYRLSWAVKAKQHAPTIVHGYQQLFMYTVNARNIH